MGRIDGMEMQLMGRRVNARGYVPFFSERKHRQLQALSSAVVRTSGVTFRKSQSRSRSAYRECVAALSHFSEIKAILIFANVSYIAQMIKNICKFMISPKKKSNWLLVEQVCYRREAGYDFQTFIVYVISK